MEYELILLEDATEEIEQAVFWYENQKKGLGAELMAALRKTIKLLKNNPKIYAAVYQEVRRALLIKFPYTLYFVVDEEAQNIVVFAFLHQSRNPEDWKKRISK